MEDLPAVSSVELQALALRPVDYSSSRRVSLRTSSQLISRKVYLEGLLLMQMAEAYLDRRHNQVQEGSLVRRHNQMLEVSLEAMRVRRRSQQVECLEEVQGRVLGFSEDKLRQQLQLKQEGFLVRRQHQLRQEGYLVRLRHQLKQEGYLVRLLTPDYSVGNNSNNPSKTP